MLGLRESITADISRRHVSRQVRISGQAMWAIIEVRRKYVCCASHAPLRLGQEDGWRERWRTEVGCVGKGRFMASSAPQTSGVPPMRSEY